MLEVNNVCVSFRSERQEKIFGTARNQVLFDVSLKVSQGTCLGILGESGSGKSTLGRVICGLLKPDTGEVKIQDVSVYASRNGRKNLQKRGDFLRRIIPDLAKRGAGVKQRMGHAVNMPVRQTDG